MITLETQCTDRKEMVQKISSFLNTPAVYLRTPTYAFQIGEITVNRDASVSGEPEQMMPVAQFLKDNGYIQDLPAELIEQPAEPDAKAQEEATEDTPVEPKETPSHSEPSPEESINRISVSIPLAECTPTQLVNILRTIYARQTLIAAMTRCDYIHMDEEVITLLSEAQSEDTEKISEILQSEAAIGMVSGIAIEEGNLKMDTTYNRENPTGWNDFANLLLAMADKAKKAHHVSSKRIEPADDEMKYFCRSWLMQLGMGGAGFKSARASLLNHLHGFAAFRTADKMNAHKAKYSEFRRELREERNREQNDA